MLRFDNTNTGGNETGTGGGLSGSDLIFTQGGSVAGATGDPSYRQLDGSNDIFNAPSGAVDFLFDSTWTIILKVSDWVDAHTATYYTFLCRMRNTNGAVIMWYGGSGGGGVTKAMHCQYKDKNNTNILSANTATGDLIPTSGDLYFVGWNDGVNNARFGWSTTKPIKWSDFLSTRRLEGSGPCDLSGSFTLDSGLWFRYINYQNSNANLKAHYIIFSNTCLIDNDS